MTLPDLPSLALRPGESPRARLRRLPVGEPRLLTPGAKMTVVLGGSNPLASIRQNLISYWKLEEASGSRADSFGSNTLTDNNTVTQATGKLGNAGQFTAANSEYLSRTGTTFSNGVSALSVSCWFYLDSLPTAGGSMCLCSKWANPEDNQFTFQVNEFGGNVRLQTYIAITTGDGGTDSDRGSTNLTTGTWYHAVLVYDGSQATATDRVKQYLNGVQETDTHGGGDFVTSLSASTGVLCLGSLGAAFAYLMDGRIDSVGLWTRVLTQVEITALYNNGNGRAIVGSEP